MAKGGGGFSDHHHKAVAMQFSMAAYDRFLHLRVLTKNGNIQKGREKDSGSGGIAHCDDDEA